MAKANNLTYTVMAVAGGALVGSAITYFVTAPKPPQLPGTETDARIARIKLQDTIANTKLTYGAIFSVQQEGGYIFYTLGFGLLGKAPNDVIVELVNEVAANRWYANIAKLGSNPVEVYVDNILQATLPSLSGVPVNTVQPAYVVVNIP